MAAYGYDETTGALATQDDSTCTYGYEELFSAFPTHSLYACVTLSRPRRQIRLLELDRVYSRDPNTAPALHGRLRIACLREHQEYSALSYVWGQEDPGSSQRQNRLVIHCNGHQHEARIGPNCWSAMWHLSKAREALTIWVDSVCIDQRNSEEKAHQIPLMEEIFKSAHTTYFWLGEVATGTNEAINFLSTSVLLVSSGTAGDIIRAAFTLFLRRHTFRVHPHRSALNKIFRRPWIERLWTLQEAVLSHNSTVVCGERSIPWEDLICALESIHFFRTQTLMLGFEDSYMAWLNLANLSRWFAESSANRSRRQNLLAQSSDGCKALERKVHRQLRCLKWALWVYSGLCVMFLVVCGSLLNLSLSHVPMTSKASFVVIIGLVPSAGYTYTWLLNTSAIRSNQELGLNSNLHVRSHSIIQELRTRKATDPKDMYFGTLGILSDDSLATPGSVLVLYKRLCASLIRRTGSLDILLFANADTEKKFPSWVIDWRLGTPSFWDKPLHWIPTWGPNQAGSARQDSVLMQSEFWMRLQNFYKRSVPHGRLLDRLFIPIEYLKARRLQRYQGATPGLNPFWEFRNQGEHLCVHGLVVTEIISRFAPIPTSSNTTESQSALRVPTASCELTHVHQVDLIELPNITFEAMLRQSEVSMFTSLVYDALSEMPETETMETVRRSNRLIDLLTNSRNSDRLLWTWWRRLLLSTANNQGALWVENLVAEDQPLKDRLDAFIESLGTGGLNVVRCQRTELCTGGLAFAGAAIQEGDSVALVSGVSYPLVLRSCGQQHFKLNGPIFLPAVTDGELMKVIRPESLGDIILV